MLKKIIKYEDLKEIQKIRGRKNNTLIHFVT